MKSKQFAIVVVVIAACGYSTVASAQGSRPQKAAAADATPQSILGAYSGEEAAYTDVEGDLTGPTTYIFHLLPNGRSFMDWVTPRNGKSGRTFGVYSAIADGKGVKVKAQFIPSMDSLATEAPNTDYFEAFTFWFSDHKVNARFIDDPKAPMFLLSRVVVRKELIR